MSNITRSEAIKQLRLLKADINNGLSFVSKTKDKHLALESLSIAIASLETDEAYQLEYESTTKNDLGVDKFDKTINQSDFEEWIMGTFPDWCVGDVRLIMNHMDEMPSVTPQEPRCKECKWWKDSDGEYRRGVGAESQCPINRKEVYEGNGYCFMFEPQESEDNNA